jgi:hypothetical protein
MEPNNNNRASESSPLINKNDRNSVANITFSSGKTILLALAMFPPIIDGIGYGALSFSQLLTTSYSLNLMQADPAQFRDARILIPLLVLPIFAGFKSTISTPSSKQNKEESLKKKGKGGRTHYMESNKS